jgi:hypothetical protein
VTALPRLLRRNLANLDAWCRRFTDFSRGLLLRNCSVPAGVADASVFDSVEIEEPDALYDWAKVHVRSVFPYLV